MNELVVSQLTDPTVHETGPTVPSEPPLPKQERAFALVTGQNPTPHQPLQVGENNPNDSNIDARSETPSSSRLVPSQTNSSFRHIEHENRDKLPRLSSSRNHVASEMGDTTVVNVMMDLNNPTRRNSTDEARPMLSTVHTQSYRRASTNGIDPILGSPRSKLNLTPTLSPREKERLTRMEDKIISHHALDRLGVDMDIVKKEKGMKKLGISDVHIEQSAQIQRYSGVSLKVAGMTTTKAELVFGFTNEQLLREKAMVVLGTSEEEILDEYSRRLSTLGVHETLPIVQRTQ